MYQLGDYCDHSDDDYATHNDCIDHGHASTDDDITDQERLKIAVIAN